jgi:hypothetical protein
VPVRVPTLLYTHHTNNYTSVLVRRFSHTT